MKLKTPTEHAIYAACFVARLGHELAAGITPEFRQGAGHIESERYHGAVKEWEEWCADVAVGAAEHAVAMHRAAVRKRSQS